MPINNPITITITIAGTGNSTEAQTITIGDEEMQNWQTRDSSYEMQSRDRVIAVVGDATLTLKLPIRARYGDEVEVLLDGGNTLTLDPNGAKVEGLTDAYTVTGDGQKLHLIYRDDVKGWIVGAISTSTSTPAPTPTPTPTPSTIPVPEYRWSFDTGTVGDPIASVSNAGSAGIAALTQDSVSARPVVALDGLAKYAKFTNGQFLEVTGINVNGLENLTIVLLSAPLDTATGGNFGDERAVIYWGESGPWGSVYLGAWSSLVQWRFGTGQENNNPSHQRPAAVGGEFTLSIVRHQGTTETLRVNKQLASTLTNRVAVLANNTNKLSIAKAFLGTANVGIKDILIYTRALTDEDISRIEAAF